MSDLTDVAAERAVLGGIYKYGVEAYYDVADIVTPLTFTDTSNEVIFKCFQHLFEVVKLQNLDHSSVLSAANELGYSFLLEGHEVEHLRAIFNTNVLLENVRPLAAKIRKLEIATLLREQLRESGRQLSEITGNESIDEILGLAENPIFDFARSLNGSETKHIAEGVEQYLENIRNNPRENIGISTGNKYYDKSIGGGLRRKSVNLIGARLKQGKAQPLDALIYTPNGPKRMGDIQIGDEICGPNNDVRKVIAIHPQGDKDVYQIKFRNNDVVECCEDHLWRVFDTHLNKYYTLSTQKIASRLLRVKYSFWAVDLPITKYTNQKVPLDPYLIGLFLGDGGLTNAIVLTTADAQIAQYLRDNIDTDYNINCSCKIGQNNKSLSYQVTSGRGGKYNKYFEIFRLLDLFGKNSHNKFIPDVYKYNSYEVRLAVIQGLMDTDGYVDENNNCEYTTTSEKLANDFKEVAQSIGMLCNITPRYTTYGSKRFLSFRIKISCNDNSILFRLQRKKDRCKPRIKRTLKKRIESITKVRRAECQCITVDNPDGLYITNNHTITHNSFWCVNVGLYISGRLQIPVLYVDTETDEETVWPRILSNITYRIHGEKGITITDIERGYYTKIQSEDEKVIDAANRLAKTKFHYRPVKELCFEEILSVMRQWIYKTVGFDENGKTRDAVIIYDYLKLLDEKELASGKMAEYQKLGFMATSLTRFAYRYDVPILCLTQLNRDGIDKEDSSTISQSDRIGWLVSNFAIFKDKSPEEIAEDGEEQGNKKLIPMFARHGEGLQFGDYINYNFHKKFGMIIEGETKNNLAARRAVKNKPLVEMSEEQIPLEQTTN